MGNIQIIYNTLFNQSYSSDSDTPLMIAVKNHNLNGIEYILINDSSSINYYNKYTGYTALTYATERKDYLIINALIKNNCTRSDFSLLKAISLEDLSLVFYLVNSDIKLNVRYRSLPNYIEGKENILPNLKYNYIKSEPNIYYQSGIYKYIGSLIKIAYIQYLSSKNHKFYESIFQLFSERGIFYTNDLVDYMNKKPSLLSEKIKEFFKNKPVVNVEELEWSNIVVDHKFIYQLTI